MGQVDRALDTRLGRTVAIKQLTARHDERFTHEARAIASLNHPHICQMIERRDPFALVYANAPVTQPLHRHPRWPDLARMMHLARTAGADGQSGP